MSQNPIFWLDGIPWFGWIAIVAIVCGFISGLAKIGCRHRERIEMIRHGMYPDVPVGQTKPVGERDF